MERHIFWRLVLAFYLLFNLSLFAEQQPALDSASKDESGDLTTPDIKRENNKFNRIKLKNRKSSLADESNDTVIESAQVTEEQAAPEASELLLPPLTAEELKLARQANLPLVKNSYVEYQLDYLTVTKRQFLVKALKRAEPYIGEMKEVMKRAGLPEDLAYLPLIESGFNYYAVSPKGATGMWQFMPQTADWIGLKRNGWVDERYDPITSCEYAAKFLKYLYNEFGDWYLALASYNYGGRNVKRAIQKGGTNDYFTLVEKGIMPQETRYYVPRFLASLIAIKNQESYDLDFHENEERYSYFTLPFMTPVNLAAKYAGISPKEFMQLNPSLRSGYIPHPNYNYRIRLPEDNMARLQKNMQELKEHSYDNYTIYYVKAGDNLSTIASNFGIPVGIIMSLNNISNSNRIWQGQKLYLPVVSRAASSSTVTTSTPGSNIIIYTVKNGETLSHIALKFGISADTIIKLNNIQNPSFIKEGQQLKVYSR